MVDKHSISVVIATAFRESTLVKTLQSIADQTRQPEEVIIVDGAPASGVETLVQCEAERLGIKINYGRWSPPSAAVQRNVGADKANGDLVLFLDDDAYPEPDCFEKMVQIFDEDKEHRIGGVGVLISNQPCLPPSPRAKRWLDFLADEKLVSYSGAVVGPAINIGPEPTTHYKPVLVDWLNSGCTASGAKHSFLKSSVQNFTVILIWRMWMFHYESPEIGSCMYTLGLSCFMTHHLASLRSRLLGRK